MQQMILAAPFKPHFTAQGLPQGEPAASIGLQQRQSRYPRKGCMAR